jgi:hypothetical protein
MDVLAFQRKWIDASRQKERSAYGKQRGMDQILQIRIFGRRFGLLNHISLLQEEENYEEAPIASNNGRSSCFGVAGGLSPRE